MRIYGTRRTDKRLFTETEEGNALYCGIHRDMGIDTGIAPHRFEHRTERHPHLLLFCRIVPPSLDAIEGLDVSDASVANQYVAEVSEADGKISVVRAAIPVIGVEDASVASQVAINATLDSNSKVSTDKANLTSITLGGYSTDGVAAADVAATDTLGTAIAKIEAMLSWTVVTAGA